MGSSGGWLPRLVLGVVLLLAIQGGQCEHEPTESECRPYIQKALKEHHIDTEEVTEESTLGSASIEQEENPSIDDLKEGSEADEGADRDDSASLEGDEEDNREGDNQTGEGEDDKTDEQNDTAEGEDGEDGSLGNLDTNEDDGSADGQTKKEAEQSEEANEAETVENVDDEGNNDSTEGDTVEQDETQEDTTENIEAISEEGDTAEEESAQGADTTEDTAEDKTEDQNYDTLDDGEGSQDGDTEEVAEGSEDGDTREGAEGSEDGDTQEVAEGSEDGDTQEVAEGNEDGDTEEVAEGSQEDGAEEAEEEGSVEDNTEEQGEGSQETGTAEDIGEDSQETGTAEVDAASQEGDTGEAEEAQEGEASQGTDEETDSNAEVEGSKEADASEEGSGAAESADEEQKDDVDETGEEEETGSGDERTEEVNDGTVETEGEEADSEDTQSEEAAPGDETTGETETDEEETQESSQEVPEEDLIQETVIPSNLRSHDHITQILRLDEESVETESALSKTIDNTLKTLKTLYDNAIKPLEILYKYRDLSNRHFGDPEIFSKPLILFMGPWSGGKSSTINYLLNNEFTEMSLRTGAEPSPAYFNILMYGDEPEILDGTQLAADWTFSGLQKFGQGLLDRLRGVRLPNRLLEKVNIVEIPGILEIRKQVQRLFPFNDACQWFIDRADIIFLVYDPAKLDVGPETEAILDQLKGREYQTRIILNKADQVKPEELMRVQGTLIWNISPLMSSQEPPVMYTTSLWSLPYEPGAPARLLLAQERAFLRDLREAIDKRVENKIASARRFAVRVRNHAKMVDCYLTTYYNHKTFFGNRKKISDDIIENPQKYHIYEGLSTLTNISRYDLPDPEMYRDFFRINPLYDFTKLSETCTYFRGCPINKLDIAIAYDLPEVVGKYKRAVESSKSNS